LLPLLLGSAGLEAGACEERAERRGVPLTELRFERRCSGDDMAGGVVCRRLASSGMPLSEGCCFGLLVKVKQAIVRCGGTRNPHAHHALSDFEMMSHWTRRYTLMLQALEALRRATRAGMTHDWSDSETSTYIKYMYPNTIHQTKGTNPNHDARSISTRNRHLGAQPSHQGGKELPQGARAAECQDRKARSWRGCRQ